MRTFPHDDETQPPQARGARLRLPRRAIRRTRAPRPPGARRPLLHLTLRPPESTRSTEREFARGAVRAAGRGARAEGASPPDASGRALEAGRFVPRDSGPRGPRGAASGRRSASRRPASRGWARGAPDLRRGAARPQPIHSGSGTRAAGTRPDRRPAGLPHRRAERGRGAAARRPVPEGRPSRVQSVLNGYQQSAVLLAARARRLRRDPEAAAVAADGAASACRPADWCCSRRWSPWACSTATPRTCFRGSRFLPRA